MLAATASADFSARVWDAVSGDELHVLQHKHIARTLAFADAAPRLVTGGARGPGKTLLSGTKGVVHPLAETRRGYRV